MTKQIKVEHLQNDFIADNFYTIRIHSNFYNFRFSHEIQGAICLFPA